MSAQAQEQQVDHGQVIGPAQHVGHNTPSTLQSAVTSDDEDQGITFKVKTKPKTKNPYQSKIRTGRPLVIVDQPIRKSETMESMESSHTNNSDGESETPSTPSANQSEFSQGTNPVTVYVNDGPGVPDSPTLAPIVPQAERGLKRVGHCLNLALYDEFASDPNTEPEFLRWLWKALTYTANPNLARYPLALVEEVEEDEEYLAPTDEHHNDEWDQYSAWVSKATVAELITKIE
jgi:hypothetical protein